jgi:hypothetical protein
MAVTEERERIACHRMKKATKNCKEPSTTTDINASVMVLPPRQQVLKDSIVHLP